MSRSGKASKYPPDARPPREITDAFRHRHPDDERYLRQALETGLTGTSSIVERYERKLAERYGMRHVLAVSSGAAAVTVALDGITWEPGDEIIVPPTCPICTVLPILSRGLKPVFCDVRPHNFGLDPDDLARVISPRTRGIIEVPMWGYPSRADELREIARAHGLPLILDLAHCHMTRLNGRWLAEYGDIACFSTHEGKFMSTGEGGFVMTNDADRDAKMRAYTRFGNLDGIHFGLNYKLGGLQAAVGLARLEALDRHVETRARNRQYILERLQNPHVRELPICEGGVVNGYALLLQVVRGDGRRFVEHLHTHGVPSDIKKYDNRPLYEYPLLAAYQRDCKNSAALLRSLTTVPLHSDLSLEDLQHIISTVNAYEC
ncbi:DegT/DnrJ/EryC1/StrS aminotransferase family protein [Vitiosangium sp. GDMCC 1.1324]|uniref:DegT/DnrJ/EryC1/StrS family aminotransferase n=1 Tax=Vitiosangium sp. (strain GDMCC 1.1324) TaxID=2138576 RepID=UPI000D3C2A30|nr:aminotransferase class I/II-fold pyridoxal phosphate-dependent enzyme [Vitiosangium sp. GDMCC 1.1324]PTL84524.1 aminotransferase [Vitiosangium sp. GDMCC 1.1324]